MNSRWQELKPKGGPSGNPAVVLAKIQEYANAIQELREESAKLHKEVGGAGGDGGCGKVRSAVPTKGVIGTSGRKEAASRWSVLL